MDESLREELLERVNSRTATIGASVPDTVTIDGAELDLSEFIVETRAIETVPPAVDRKLASVKATLREERRRRLDRLEGAVDAGEAGNGGASQTGDANRAAVPDALDREAAERLADEIIGIDRALNALETIRHPDFADEHRSATLDGHERWLAFVDEVQ
ncbi:DUF5788 family protein [Halorubrum sp. CBA1229]|jgi:hypothetical protein|uniref:DUF5788 family protein n=1 Tax=Halorubrum sp. CBA1229 TaxID=1853699 RepID=UPI000F3C28EC|nr:DUF5788 family protein [Halorubrum sp. CBA1229]QKY15439.1 hypothetical protein Hrr1229_000515 [Halorubrum sp. CBA1229]